MGLFGKLFGHNREQDRPELLPAIERAVNGVEPLLKQTSGYPESYQKSVATAWAYAHSLAENVPGPVVLNRESYAKDAFVHALFPSVDFVTDAFCTSRAMQDYYRKFPDTDELYALMGMRRVEKTISGMALSGELIQHDVLQKAVYFTSHTIENPAPTEKQAREQVALSFFDSLVSKIKQRVEARKQKQRTQLQEKNLLVDHLRTADAQSRPALEKELSRITAAMKSDAGPLDLNDYLEDFEAILLNPELHLKIIQTSIILDSMGIRREGLETSPAEAVIFNELIDFDRRNWTVTMVHCNKIQSETLTTRLEKAYRQLAI
ncbi:MAG: hypothetical protein WC208_06540 [Gallionella sp.]|jgi:hypothetical protein